MIQFDPRNRSTYHAGILKVQRRFSQGIQFLSSYTWSKSLDYGGSAASGGGQTGGPQTVTNLNAGKGPSGLRRAAPLRLQRRLRAAVRPGQADAGARASWA